MSGKGKKRYVDLLAENTQLKIEISVLQDKLDRIEKRLKSFAIDGLKDLYEVRLEDLVG